MRPEHELITVADQQTGTALMGLSRYNTSYNSMAWLFWKVVPVLVPPGCAVPLLHEVWEDALALAKLGEVDKG